ncbi:hypothetical protein TWF730_003912 [Orbilia blumenaviensis]|uniref:Chromatin assembly factor 1 subunit A n=1 Tax=Orbilia blumenaviensis TaxID=1796055 RepID=A0AAV9U217_9PEZI
MTSEPGQGDTTAEIRYTDEASSPLSSAPPSPPSRKRTASPIPEDSLPDTETTKKLSNLGLDGTNDAPPKKRAKLTPAEKAEKEREKEEKRREKEERDREKAKVKAEKDEQKRLKDEEKAKKEREKAADKARRDEEKAKRDEERVKKDAEKVKREEEKAKKEEEKLKKDRAQLRMDSFFTRKGPMAASTAPKAPLQVVAPTKVDEATTPSQPILKLSGIGSLPTKGGSGPTVPDVEMLDNPVSRSEKSDYTKTFQPFFVRAGVTLAYETSKAGALMEEFCREMDRVLSQSIAETSDEMDVEGSGEEISKSTLLGKLSPSEFETIFGFPLSSKRGQIRRLSTKQILARLNSSPGPVPDIFGQRKSDNTDYVAELRKLPRKILKYAEDVRPAYRGTYTRVPTKSGLRKGRNPFQRSLPGVDYDYDSEAEWVQEPDDDGEDIMSEEDEDPMEAGSADEMDDFLDDEDEVIKKKVGIAGPLIPAASGLMWDGECPKSEELMNYRIGVLIEGCTIPINPFSKEYWVKDKRKLGPQSRLEEGKPKAQPAGWWTSASQKPVPQQLHGSATLTHSSKVQSTTPISHGPPQDQVADGEHSLRYGQNHSLPLNWGSADKGHPRYSSVPYLLKGISYYDAVLDPAARDAVLGLDADKRPHPLSSLVDPQYARSLGISAKDHYQFFMIYHNIDLCGLVSYEALEQCHNFIVGNDATKVAMLEALKKMFSSITKPALKRFMDTYFIRSGVGNDKRWKCVFKKDEFSYWMLDLEVCKLVSPGTPVATVMNQPGPSRQP